MAIQLLVLVFFLTFVSSPSLAQRLSSMGNEKLDVAMSNLEGLETEFGQNNPILVEPLAELAGLYGTTGRYVEADRSLDRAIQIVRRDEGLYARNQLPYLQKKIENFVVASDWGNARQQMEHINWLYLQKSEIADPLLIADLMHLSDMHLRGINEDFGFYQSYHFRNAMRLNWASLRVAELIYGRGDERLIPIIYALIKQYHLQQAAVDGGGSLGYQLRQYFPGSELVRTRSEVKNYFYFMGRRLLNQITSIYSESEEPKIESLAMALLYTADWQALFGRHEEALKAYFESYAQLEALYPNGVTSLFQEPKLLPVESFYESLERALLMEKTTEKLLAQPTSVHGLSFVEWGTNFPHARQPYDAASSMLPERNEAVFVFNLSGVSDIKEWADTRNAQNFDRAIDLRVSKRLDASGKQQEILERRVKRLRYRPKLIRGLPQQSEVILEYKMAPAR